MSVTINGATINHGDAITCKIKDIKIDDARIYIRYNPSDNNYRMWICHNEKEADGDASPDRFGYRYSWVFTFYPDSHMSDDVSDIFPSLTGVSFKNDVSVEKDLINFLQINNYVDMLKFFEIKCGIFDDFSTYTISSKEGFINLKNDKKSVEIKISRFIKQVSLKIEDITKNEKCPFKFDIKDKTIEDLYNRFVSFQKGDKTSIEFLTGEDILDGYDSKNYVGGDSVINKSCMVDKFDYLNIYTKNPNQVSLAVVKSPDGKILARTMVWKTTDGSRHFDRIYYRYDWLEPLVREKLNILGITSIGDESFKVVKLENWKFEAYPYLDNFYYFDRERGQLLAMGQISTRTLRQTDGRW